MTPEKRVKFWQNAFFDMVVEDINDKPAINNCYDKSYIKDRAIHKHFHSTEWNWESRCFFIEWNLDTSSGFQIVPPIRPADCVGSVRPWMPWMFNEIEQLGSVDTTACGVDHDDVGLPIADPMWDSDEDGHFSFHEYSTDSD